jgi:predicted phosphate transport protein (TIGR00153 family)
MRIVVQCADQVPAIMEALCQGNGETVRSTRDEIFRLENRADGIKNELRAHLPKRLFMPVDRRDLLEILDMQDSIADTAQDIAGMLVLRKLEVIEPMKVPLLALTRRCVDACHQMAKIMEQLDELLESGFRGPESERVLEMIDELNKIETDTDHKGAEVLRLLFDHEEEIGPVSVIIWLRVIRWIGELADFAEKAGNRHRLLLAR